MRARLFRQLERLERVRKDPGRIVDYLRQPRHLVVGPPVANKLGLQVVRALKERVAWRVRPARVSERARPIVDALERDGFVILPDFFAPIEFARLEAELDRLERLPPDRVAPFGRNFEARLVNVARRGDEFPAFAELLRDNGLLYEVACAVSRRGRSYPPNVIVQWVQKPNPNEPHEDYDYNSYLHVDRHYPHLKAFFYIRDVPADRAPYTYVRGSHSFNVDRLRFEYRIGVEQSVARRRTTTENLYRPEQKQADARMEHAARDLCAARKLEVVPIAGKRNTLVLSNNAGLHCRGPMTSGEPRVTVNLDYKFLESWAHTLRPVLGGLVPQ